MKICVFTNSFPPAISESWIAYQVAALAGRGHRVFVEASQPSSDTQRRAFPQLQELPIEVHSKEFPAARLSRLVKGMSIARPWIFRNPALVLDSLNIFRYGLRAATLSRLFETLPRDARSRCFDVVQCHFGANGSRAVQLRRLGVLSGPIVTTFHGYDVNRALQERKPHAVYKALFAEGDAFTVGSGFMRNQLAGLGAPCDRIHVIPLGVELSKFSADSQIRGGKRILTVARLVEFKGVEYGIRAAAILKKIHPGLEYRIVGDGPLRGTLENLADKLGVNDIVTFAGALEYKKVVSEIERADLFVLPGIVASNGDVEGQCVALAEAQAMGIPVVASSVGGIPEAIQDGVTGLLAPPKDVEALARAIDGLLANRDRCRDMGAKGRAFVEERFNIRKQVDKIEALFQGLTAKAGECPGAAAYS